MHSEQDDIEQYRQGKLDGAKRNALEKRALHDPFLADALEGVESVTPEELSGDLLELSGTIQSRQARKTNLPSRIAASIVVILGASIALYYFTRLSEPLPLALQPPVGTVHGDSLNGKPKDSTATLLSLAQPDKTQDIHKTNPEPSPSPGAKESTVDESASSTVAAKQLEEKTAAADVKVEQEQGKALEREVADDKDVVVNKSAPTSLSSGVADQKQEELLKRESRAAGAKDKKKSIQNFQNISGTVTADNGTALQGVNVTVKGSAEGAVTDDGGNYTLNTRESDPQLVFSSIGLARKEIREQSQPLNVQLGPDVNQRSEVSVAGAGISNQGNAGGGGSFELAQPAGGRDEFQKYLENNVRYPAIALANKTEGIVTIQFKLHADGSFSSFEVIHGVGDGCEEELIRLIRQGPSWSPTRLNNTSLEDKVTVQFRFLLSK